MDWGNFGIRQIVSVGIHRVQIRQFLIEAVEASPIHYHLGKTYCQNNPYGLLKLLVPLHRYLKSRHRAVSKISQNCNSFHHCREYWLLVDDSSPRYKHLYSLYLHLQHARQGLFLVFLVNITRHIHQKMIADIAPPLPS